MKVFSLLQMRDFFNRKELLQVGAVTNMYDIVERMEKAEKVIKP